MTNLVHSTYRTLFNVQHDKNIAGTAKSNIMWLTRYLLLLNIAGFKCLCSAQAFTTYAFNKYTENNDNLLKGH